MAKEKAVYAHLCSWFRTKEVSGKWEMWNSDYPQNLSNPDVVNFDGTRQIAANSYPLTDLYDSTDPDILDYQFSLMKLSGIDGIVVDWDGRRLNAYRHDGLMKSLPYIEKYNLKLIICYEEWCGYEPPDYYPDRPSQINAAVDELKWLCENLIDKSFYGIVNGKKPVLIFRKIPDLWFIAEEYAPLREVADQHNASLIMPVWVDNSFIPVSEGDYYWVSGFDEAHRCDDMKHCMKAYDKFLNDCKNSGRQIFGSVYPGFDDTYVWGWGDLPRIAPRYEAERFKKLWEKSIEQDIDFVQLITWNDWNEGSHIEPANTFGYEYLKLNKKYSAQFKNIEDNIPDDLLTVPLEIYKKRKLKEDTEDLEKSIFEFIK